MPTRIEGPQAISVRRRPLFRRELTAGEANVSRAAIAIIVAGRMVLSTLGFEAPPPPPPATPPAPLREKISAGAKEIYAGTPTEEYFKRAGSRFDAVYCGGYATTSDSDASVAYIGFRVTPDISGNLLRRYPGQESPVVGALNQGEEVAAQKAVFREVSEGREQTWVQVGEGYVLTEDENGNVNAATRGLPECRAASKMGSK